MTPSIKSVVGRVFSVLPVLLPAALAAFGMVAMVLLLFGALYTWLAYILGGLVAAMVAWLVWRAKPAARPGSLTEKLIVDVLAVAFVILWGIFNAYYASEHLFTNRDPATYATSAAWLVDHSGLDIATPSVFGKSSDITNESPGFLDPDGSGNSVHAQGQHLFPVLLGLAGRVVGQDYMLRLSPIIGALALLAVYGFARLLVRPTWALIATASLAATLPMIYFSRDSYTEPLSMVFIFGGLALMWQAQAWSRLWLWFLTGVVFGAGALVRIDTYLIFAGLALAVALCLAVVNTKRRQALKGVCMLGLGILLPALVAWLDTTMLSVPYYNDHKTLIYQELLGCLAAVALGAVVVVIAWNTKIIERLDVLTKKWRIPILIAIIVLVSLLLAFRPLVDSPSNKRGVNEPYISSIQSKEGLPIEPRSYAEHSAYWISWYVSVPVLLLGVAGLCLTAVHLFRTRGYLLLAALGVFAVTAAVYLLNPSIVPDQIWAVRRFLPVVIPFVIIFACYALYSLFNRAPRTVNRLLLLTLAVIFMIHAPLVTSHPFLFNRDTNQLALFSGLCRALPQDAAVIWAGEGQYYNVQATRSLCNVPTQAFLTTDLGPEDFGAAAISARDAGYVPVLAIFAGDGYLVGDQRGKMTVVSEVTYYEMAPTIMGAPKTNNSKSYQFMIATVNNDGTLERTNR